MPMTDIEKARRLIQDSGLSFPTITQELAIRLKERGNMKRISWMLVAALFFSWAHSSLAQIEYAKYQRDKENDD
jgi:hypothetical protein